MYDARDHYDKKSSKADESIRSIKIFLTKAVDSCIEAAGHEFNTDLQKSLLRAASFGKSFLESYPAAKFVDMNRTLRVLNSIRNPKIGIPLTIGQYYALTSEGLVNILSNRHHYGLAKKICEYLNIPSERVLIHWACFQGYWND